VATISRDLALTLLDAPGVGIAPFKITVFKPRGNYGNDFSRRSFAGKMAQDKA